MTSPFAILGIAPTDDKRAIKRAYAAKLKATDVEADPKAFIKLREAFEHANWQAEYLDEHYGQYGEEEAVAAEAPAAGPPPVAVDSSRISDAEIDVPAPSGALEDAELFEPDDEADDEDPARWRWEPNREPSTYHQQDRIVALLWGDRPAEEIAPELAEAVHTILTAPEMEAIDHAASIEDWMASIIAQSIPRSDPMTRIAAPHFGWDKMVDDWRRRYGVSQAAARFADLAAIDRLNRTDHRWHDAWVLLKQPPPDAYGWKRLGKHRESIVALLESIRTHNPALEHELDADHVATWDAAIAAPSETSRRWNFRWWWWVLIALYAFVQFARFAGELTPEPEPPAAVETIDRDHRLLNQSQPDEARELSGEIERRQAKPPNPSASDDDYVTPLTVGTGGTDESSATDCKTVDGEIVCSARAPPPTRPAR